MGCSRTLVRTASLLLTVKLLVLLSEATQPDGSLNMWIDAHQARVLIGFEEDILIVSDGKMAPFTHDFRKAQQRMPAIPVNIQAINFTWQATGQALYFYEFQSLRSLDKDVMGDPTVNIPLRATISHKATVVQIGFPCLGSQDGVAAFEVTVVIMDVEGNVVLQTPHNAIFFKTCQRGEPKHSVALFYSSNCTNTCYNGGTCFHPAKCICPPGYEGDQCEINKCRQPCRNGGKCTGRNKCKCIKGYQGDLCSKPVCEPDCGPHGSCIEPNKCECREGWHGRHCNKRYGASLMNALRSAGFKHRQHTPLPKENVESHIPAETNYIW
ncbi:wnt inhibitory factor 1 [Chiloscyllium plagiosum]|uniref:wnt inhibitory factor 1 n=1 Tax=Chiloscyllium plagiosum TaxID=36176 RepID=UPI001CB840CA|nr:wnt inhibitory factor 1 [Chiloscyllium plagiosum]